MEIVVIEGVEEEEKVRIGTSIGGTEMNYNWKEWEPVAVEGLILL